jgi:hypothetical protein
MARPEDPCGYCRGVTRPLYARGSGTKNARTQAPKWRVCDKGHRLYRKRDQV